MSTETRKYEKKARAEREDETREKIAGVAADLHAEIGPTNTTVAEIARRAGVSRLTVYNHFPDDDALYPACSAHWQRRHPMPDFGPAFAEADPRNRVRGVVLLLYRDVYRGWGDMMRNLQSARPSDKALDDFMRANADVAFAGIAEQLAAGFGARGKKAGPVRAMSRLAIDFWTWSRLDAEGLSDRQAAELMADAVAAVGQAK